jgi:hypothetical protein
MRRLLILAVFALAVMPGRSFTVPAPAAEAPILVDEAGVLAPGAETPVAPLPDEETHEDGDPAVVQAFSDHHGENAVPHFDEYLIPSPKILGYPPLIPPDGGRA